MGDTALRVRDTPSKLPRDLPHLPHFGDGQPEWNSARVQRVLGRRENPFERTRLPGAHEGVAAR
jgi:hypothetical protein